MPATHAPPRLTVAFLKWQPLDDASFADSDQHWLASIPGLLAARLRECSSLRVLPETMVVREHNRMCQSGPTNLTPEAGFRLFSGRLKSDWIVQGLLAHENQSWTLKLRLMDAMGRQSQPVLGVDATNLFELRDRAVEQLLQQFQVTPTAAELARMKRRETQSAVALETLSRALACKEESLNQCLALIREALAADPEFIEARAMLAVTLYNLGDTNGSLAEARRVLSRNPEDGCAAQMHLIIGSILAFQEQDEPAMREVAEGLRLRPENPELLMLHADARVDERDYEGAMRALTLALASDPRNAALHARLASVCLLQGNLTNALRHLAIAESLAAETPKEVDLDAELALARSFSKAGNMGKALEHYHRLLGEAERKLVPEERLSDIRSAVRELERRSEPVPVEAKRPKAYPAEELKSALEARLDEKEIALAVNPLASTAEMERWARENLADTEDGRPRARRLFELMAERPQTAATGSRTAREVFEAWSDPNESFSCQEFAKLFIALARSVGLTTFYVHVDRDYAGNIVDHDCAILFEGGNAWLVDPAYRWFGVPHQEFRILDDLQAVAHNAFQPHDQEVRVELCRAGLKLDPEFVWGRWNLVMALIYAGQLEEARRELDAVREQAPGQWCGYQLEGLLAFKHDQLDAAKQWWSKTVDLNPSEGNTHLLLGEVLFRMGEQAAARREILTGLRRPYLKKETEELARGRLKLLNEALGSDAAGLRPDPSPTEAGAYSDLGLSYLSGPTADYAAAVTWFRKAAELGDPAAQCYLGILYWKGQGVQKNRAEAARWIHKAAHADDPAGMRLLAMIYLACPNAEKRQAEAIRWLRRSAEAGDNLSRMLLGRLLYEGQLTSKNMAEALFWLTLAAEAQAETTNGVAIGLSPGGLGDSRKESIALLKEVKLFATPEELAQAQAKLEQQRKGKATSGTKDGRGAGTR